jgi:transcriptional regulator GlxA family with amidase domain
MVYPGMQREPAATVTVDDIRVRHALSMMAKRLHDPIPITELAQRLQLSTRHVERLFQGAVGARPGTVYRAMRLHHAHWMLNNTRQPITSIAIDTGFSDGAHFSRQFKQMTGISPREARRQSTASQYQNRRGTAHEGK